MYKIVKAEQLSEKNFLMVVEAPWVVRSCQPGQFLIVKIDEVGERIPLTICDYDREAGTVTIVFQTIGASTERMAKLKAGDYFMDVTGPLGRPSDLVEMDPEELKKMNILFVGGGVGAAPVYPQVKWMAEHGYNCEVIIGAKTKELIMLEEEMKKVAVTYVATDDGSYGYHGMIPSLIEYLVNSGKKYDRVVAIGPVIMMKFVCVLTKKLGLPTVVSMNPIMVDGTGMCGACRIMVGGEVKFACVDGPEFDGHLVDFDLAMERQRTYKTEEGRALLRYREGLSYSGKSSGKECGGDK
jgi:ferredoxin--NADP+ reductase